MPHWRKPKTRSLIRVVLILCFIQFFITSTCFKKLIQKLTINSDVWVHPRCNCSKGLLTSHSDLNLTSTCPSATFRGPHQKVLSYSFYGNDYTSYFQVILKMLQNRSRRQLIHLQGVPINAETIASLYPGWTMRLYHNIDPTDGSAMSKLCREVCIFGHLDECYVGDVTNQFQNITTKFGMFWRFLVMGDPTVDTFAVRDLDSNIYPREVDAVNDWLATNRTWHIMRDHPSHFTTILGGMWGARNHNISQMKSIRRLLIAKANVHYKEFDQLVLHRLVWPIAKQNMVAHDSFHCQLFPDTVPWPSPRVNATFVGDVVGLSITEECPLECRPKDHQDWVYC